jgi:SAM-dependent methyltransferase
VSELADAAWALAAISVATDTKLLRSLAEGGDGAEAARQVGMPAALCTRVLDVLAAVGFVTRENGAYLASPGLAEVGGDPDAASRLSAELRTALLQAAELSARGRGKAFEEGWRHEDPEILRTQGVASAGAVPDMAQRLIPSLGDLEERLSRPGGAALDVGTGVAAVATGLANHFPDLRVVGLEPAPAPMAEARRNIAAAGLEGRIELRSQRVEDLADEAAFDFAFLPIVFLATDTLRSGLASVLRALRPGGWVLMGSLGVPGDELGPALARLKATLWGSEALPPEEVGRLAEEIGYDEVRFFPGGNLIPIVARRPL